MCDLQRVTLCTSDLHRKNLKSKIKKILPLFPRRMFPIWLYEHIFENIRYSLFTFFYRTSALHFGILWSINMNLCVDRYQSFCLISFRWLTTCSLFKKLKSSIWAGTPPPHLGTSFYFRHKMDWNCFKILYFYLNFITGMKKKQYSISNMKLSSAPPIL